MLSDSKKDLLHGAPWLSPASNSAHSRGSLFAPTGRVFCLIGSKGKLVPTGNSFGVGKSRKLNRSGCLGQSWVKESLCLDKLSPLKHLLAVKSTSTSFQRT